MQELLFLWQLPQLLLGKIYFLITYSKVNHILQIGKFEDVLIFVGNYKGGMTLGNYIFLSASMENSDYIIRHELGHVKQSKILGPLYLILIGLPSIIWATLHSNVKFFKKFNYYSFFTEKWANKLAGLK